MRRYKYPILGLLMLITTFALLNSSFLFTYRSRANEDVVNNFASQQQSTESVSIYENLPTCVTSLVYIPIEDKSVQSCFVQFTCVNNPSALFFNPPHYSCSQQAEVITCSENEDNNKCGYIDAWIQGAAYTCGC